jgi:hypothetical protein
MGTLHYGAPSTPIRIADDALEHLKLVIVTKLRRDESFTLTWANDDAPGGRSTIWIHPSIPLRFDFDRAERVALQRQWVDELADAANSGGGIVLEHPHVTAKG